MCERERGRSSCCLYKCENDNMQCAHGRPTTAPLVDLEALQGQIAKMQVRDDEGRELWHGLCRQGVSLERASMRLRAAADEIPN